MNAQNWFQLVHWINEVISESESEAREVFHAAVLYLRKFCKYYPNIPKSSLQLVCCACISLAFKVQINVEPSPEHLVLLTVGSYTAGEMVQSEYLLLRSLNGRLLAPSLLDKLLLAVPEPSETQLSILDAIQLTVDPMPLFFDLIAGKSNSTLNLFALNANPDSILFTDSLVALF